MGCWGESGETETERETERERKRELKQMRGGGKQGERESPEVAESQGQLIPGELPVTVFVHLRRKMDD